MLSVAIQAEKIFELLSLAQHAKYVMSDICNSQNANLLLPWAELHRTSSPSPMRLSQSLMNSPSPMIQTTKRRRNFTRTRSLQSMVTNSDNEENEENRPTRRRRGETSSLRT